MATKKKNLKKPSAKATQSAPVTGTATAQPQAQPDPTALSNEMAGVGFLYNKLQAFLAKVAPEQKKPEDATKTAEGK